jgi:hypothetical protein
LKFYPNQENVFRLLLLRWWERDETVKREDEDHLVRRWPVISQKQFQEGRNIEAEIQ